MWVWRLTGRVFKWPVNVLFGLAAGAFAWTLYLVFRNCSTRTRCRWFQPIARVLLLGWPTGRRNIKTNLALIQPDLSERQLVQSARTNIKTFVLNWAELLGDELPDPESIRKKCSGVKGVLEKYSEGRRIVVVFPHIGPIHSLMYAIAAFEVQVFVPIEATPPLLYKLMARQRGKRGDIQFAPVRKGKVLEKCAEKLVEGRIVIMAMDVLTESGVPCPVGPEAIGRFPVGAVRLALKSDALLFPAFPSWDKDGEVKLLIGNPLTLVRSGNLEKDTVDNVRELVRCYEPFLIENCASWWRLPWSKLEPVGEG